MSDINFFNFGTASVASARSAFSPHVRTLGLLLGLTQSGNTGSATLNTCCLNAQVSRAWEAHWWLTFFWDDLLRTSPGSDHAKTVLLATFLSTRYTQTPRAIRMYISFFMVGEFEEPNYRGCMMPEPEVGCVGSWMRRCIDVQILVSVCTGFTAAGALAADR